jgi:hypothetical protein
MGKRIVPLRPGQKKGVARPLTLADIAQVSHPIGPNGLAVSGAQLAQLIDAAQPLHGQDAEWDFLNHHAIAIELRDMAELMIELMGDEARPCAFGYLSDQLRRLSNRVAAVAPRQQRPRLVQGRGEAMNAGLVRHTALMPTFEKEWSCAICGRPEQQFGEEIPCERLGAGHVAGGTRDASRGDRGGERAADDVGGGDARRAPVPRPGPAASQPL